MDLAILREIVQGGIDKVKEAECVLIGGHTVEDKELKYGLSVTGVVHPDRVVTKHAMRPGDWLVITKPLGTGIVNTAIKAGLASESVTDRVTRQMAALNREAARVMDGFFVHACTDVTGFGLIGHLAEMVENSGCSVRIESAAVPRIEEAFEYAAMGLIPAGAYRNREFREKMVHRGPAVKLAVEDLLYDPQTSGGLLISVAEASSGPLVSALKAAGVGDAVAIGEVLKGPEEKIYVE
jgi:selenide,water dikinase